MTTEINTQDWQQAFIATNILAIAYNAWIGYLGGERGVVICSTNSPHLSMAGETFKAHFIPRKNLAAFLNAWLTAPDTVLLQRHFMNAHILEAVDKYNPQKDIVFLLEYGNQAGFFYLTNLPITPPQCYHTVRKEWAKFQLPHTLLTGAKTQ
ncbi:hypothetical protein HUN01_03010 [Nostoc edaphicum CCNP1411]|uniref:Uncharacterized protein n=1 Tax=Nostoc edaphicum CCNP1411 TaxID=1472755 RepID=A0A7D7QJZ6_9NOSO|nr:hypothetical protein [Nostoc edaphicum]QMS86585.1 hypothetical protein HUN01_03010 [Nostoc edaphicum CCNP1411]